MLRQLKPERSWHGLHFHATADTGRLDRDTRFHFWRPAHRIMLSFGEEDWDRLKEVFSIALEDPGLEPVLSALILEYGDL